MNNKDKTQNSMKKFFKDLLKEAAQIITNEIGGSLEGNLEKLTQNFKTNELTELFDNYDKSSEKENVKNKILAKYFESSYKNIRYKQPLIIDGDYMDFVNDIELLIKDGLKIDKNKILNLLFLFKEKILPVFQYRPRLPSFKNVWSLKKPEFIEWIKRKSEELEGLSVLQKRFQLKKEISTPGNKFIVSTMELEKKILKDPESLKQNIISLIHNIQDYYESYRLVSGLLIAIYDLKDGKFDDDLNRSYFGNYFHTDKGFYSKREVCVKNKSKPDLFKRLTLKEYFKKYPLKDIHLFYQYLIKEVKQIRLTGGHHSFLIEQNIDDLKKGVCKIQYKGQVEDYHVRYLQEVQYLLYFYLVLLIYITSCFLFDNT